MPKLLTQTLAALKDELRRRRGFQRISVRTLNADEFELLLFAGTGRGTLIRFTDLGDDTIGLAIADLVWQPLVRLELANPLSLTTLDDLLNEAKHLSDLDPGFKGP
jgi:hypothetical protein